MKLFNKKNKDQQIVFRAQDEHVWQVREKPVPASKLLPKWWKDMPHYGHPFTSLELAPMPSVTVKRCLSAADAISSGYIVTLWSDIQVKYDPVNGTEVKWISDYPVFGMWSSTQVSDYELTEGFGDTVFKYLHGWGIKTPPGYSSLFIHPIGYQNLPFRAIPGIVDTDKLDTDINVPVIFKKGFEGIIEKGTPIFQIIPFKRDNWVSSHEVQGPKEFYLNAEKLKTKIVSSYARYLRSPKSYK
jgi:hypothetical protein